MWLLSTDRAELHYFQNNYDATGGYAILSHTWTKNEQTLQDVRDIIKRCHAEGTNPRDDPALSPKIRNCCIIAAKYGYRWVWIDSCCIDKTSSSELSDAIGAMFTWYQQAEVCFAYLADVLSDCELRKPGSTFRESRWHRRGWTLQELIAPEFLIFLSVDWNELGNRAGLAELLEVITRVPSDVLTGKTEPANYSVSIRMSWVSSRKTTLVEDEAYCLLGLLGVRIPAKYGEGKHAFIRLQYEVLKHHPDMSLFVFGNFPLPNFTVCQQEVINDNERYLMADSPGMLEINCQYIPDLKDTAKQHADTSLDLFHGGAELPRISVTSYGVKLRLPIHEADGITIAVILCRRNRRNVGLFMTRDSSGKDCNRPRYFAGCVYTTPDTESARLTARLADLGDDLHNLTFNRKPLQASWRTIYVVPTYSYLDSGSCAIPKLMINRSPSSRFRIPSWLIARFTALQFAFREIENTEMLQVLDIFLHGVVQIYVSFGSCMQRDNGSPDNSPVLWAKVDVLLSHMRVDTFTHECSEDHLDSESWGTRSKAFGDADRGVRFSLIPSTRMPDSSNSFVIHLELLGEKLKEAGGLSMFPSITELERDTQRPVPNSDPPPRSPSPSVLPPTQDSPSRNPSASLTERLRRWFPSVPRAVRTRRLDSPVPALESKLRTLILNVPDPAGTSGAANEVGSSMAGQQDDERDKKAS